MTIPVFRMMLLTLALATPAWSQLSATLQIPKRQYIGGEPVTAVINITNYSGRDLTFGSTGGVSWLDFIVKNSQGHPVTPAKNLTFGTVTIQAGQTMARQVILSSFFPLFDPGNYTVSGVVRMPGDPREGTSTNRASFTLTPGRRIWTQKVGLPDRPGEVREYRLLSSSDGTKSNVYAQVIDDRTGLPVNTFAIGEAILSRRPLVTLDRQQRMHVLYLGTPSVWVHTVVGTDGRMIDRSLHQRGPHGDPKLMAYTDGSVAVSNSIPFDPEAAVQQRENTRKISDRPAFLYE